MINLRLKNPTPLAATIKGWKEWETKAKSEEPIKFWFYDTLPGYISDTKYIMLKPFKDIKNFVRYRTYDKHHIINTGLVPGYHECDTRLMHGMFNLLVDFVEVELAWMNYISNKENKASWWKKLVPSLKSYRDPESGIDYLNWEATLDDPKLSEFERSDLQAANAREKLVIYNWWKFIRPAREDAIDLSGWSAWSANKRKKNGVFGLLSIKDDSDEEKDEIRRILAKRDQIDAAYDEEDTQMMIRLCKIRLSLWS